MPSTYESRELIRVTNLLCKVCEELFSENEDLVEIALDAARIDGLEKWWKKHQRLDAKRS